MSTLDEFIMKKAAARKKLFDLAIKEFKNLSAVAIFQFGSGSHGYTDEFSDIDLFTIVKDESYENIISEREQIYARIAPLLLHNGVYYEDKSIGRSYYHDLMLYEVDEQIIHLDNYFLPQSRVLIPNKAILIYGSDDFPRDEDILIGSAIYTDKSLAKQLKGLHAMTFVAVKAFARYQDTEFLSWVKVLFIDYFRQKEVPVPELPEKTDFVLILKMLENLKNEGGKKEQYLNQKIYSYAKEVEGLYIKS